MLFCNVLAVSLDGRGLPQIECAEQLRLHAGGRSLVIRV